VGKEDGYQTISRRSRSTGAQASVSFQGTGAVVVGALGNDGGYAEIYLDGKLVTKVDAYNDDDRYNEGLWGKFDMKPGTHTVRILMNGQPYPGSKDAWINLEDLIVYRK
jgi:hypothetical protein